MFETEAAAEFDDSEKLFSVYWEMVGEEDKKMVEGWKTDADRILTFTGLFSSAVTTLIAAVSIKDIRPNPQDTSNFYLSNVYQILSDPTRANVSLPLSPPPFSPPRYAVRVNTLWFLSLVISLTCALLASLVQQWARRYLTATQRHYRPHKRATIHAFFAEGMEKFHLSWAFEVLPMLLHISLFLFFAGLVVFLWTVDQTLFKLVLSLVAVCSALYGIITIMPLYRHDCPYYTPLTSPAWSILIGAPYVVVQLLSRFTSLGPYGFGVYNRFWTLGRRYHSPFFQTVWKTAEETALNSPSKIDTRIFKRMLDTLNEDHELERFFSRFLGPHTPNVVSDHLARLTEQGRHLVFENLFGLLDRTFASDSLPHSVKNRRATLCAEVLKPPVEIRYQQILEKIVSEEYRGLKTAEFGYLVKGWSVGGNHGTVLAVQTIIACIVATAQRHDGSWFTLASDALRVQKSVLEYYAPRRNDLSLVILLCLIRQQRRTIRDRYPQYVLIEALSTILGQASKFRVRVTSPELKHEFCTLWNEIVLEARTDDQNLRHKLMAWNILRQIRDIYVSLQDNDSVPTWFASAGDKNELLRRPSSYPLCNVCDHHLDAALHIHDIETSAPVHPTPRAPTSPPSTVSVQPTADSDKSDVPLSPSPTPGKTPSQNIPLIGSHSSVLSPPTPGPSLPQISASNLGTASIEEGSPTDALREEQDSPLPTG